jgi:lipopolysaccharide transport system ATP-binding protein
MNATAISVENIGKQYRIGAPQMRYRTFRESMSQAVQAPFRRVARLMRGEAYGAKDMEKEFWALRGITFDVHPGEVVGIIGRNGAGKSTLLKILSRITEPTEGRVEIRGRVGSLLEVGTGFHHELTGRENIFLNGAILGMRRAEIEDRFDRIVSFAEIERFIDTPVKHYSSGMYVRLAFAVAAHLEPEILLVDEVLAVGDASFQKKCLGKMGQVATEGRTVLFVSHNMGAIVSLCSRCLLIEEGRIVKDGEVHEVTSYYQSRLYTADDDTSDLSDVERYGSGKAQFTSAKLSYRDADGSPLPIMQTGKGLLVDLKIKAHAPIEDANVALILYDSTGYRLIDANTALQGSFLNLEQGQEASVRFHLNDVLLKPGSYLLGLWLGRSGSIGEDIDGITYVTTIKVEPDPQSLMHWQTYPGTYQCRFSHQISRGKEPDEDTE